MARPQIYTDDTVVYITGRKAKTRLQSGSDRRAIVNVILDNGGTMTLGALDEHFGFDIRQKAIALTKSGWLEMKL